jgi:2-polyprenyl-3-methyl-5-hydroxy-6-metoxy-1,4-benzoquinol methylase
MPSFTNRSYQPELLDNMNIPFVDIRRNMQELDTINTLLGGHAITIRGVKKLLQHHKDTHISICEIGCGGGDNLRAIDKWLRKQNIRASYIGIDINPYCIEHARTVAGLGHAQWIVSDYKKFIFGQKPAIIFGSLFCHHFNDEELVAMFQWMHRNAATGFFINDLHRHWFAYHSIKLLTAAFSRSYMVKNDAPLSVLRGFSKKELIRLMQQAGLLRYSIEWKWAFRWLVTVIS